jgi:hypothetical protein
METINLKLIRKRKEFFDIPEIAYLLIILSVFLILLFISIINKNNILFIVSVIVPVLLVFLIKKRYGLFVRNYNIIGFAKFSKDKVNLLYDDKTEIDYLIKGKTIKIYCNSYQNYISGRGGFAHTGINRIELLSENDTKKFDFLVENKSQLEEFLNILKSWYKLAESLIEKYKDEDGVRLLLMNPNYKFSELQNLKKKNGA